jgi:hypothetical protein
VTQTAEVKLLLLFACSGMAWLVLEVQRVTCRLQWVPCCWQAG